MPELIDLLSVPPRRGARSAGAPRRDRFERMHALALRRSAKRWSREARNVIVIHGIMGGELTATPSDGAASKGAEPCNSCAGASCVKLQPDGVHDAEAARPAGHGMIQKYYGELTLRLSELWNAVPVMVRLAQGHLSFSDRAPERAAEGLRPRRTVSHRRALDGRPRVAHVHQSRTAMPESDAKDGARLGGRLIMMGTPNFGSSRCRRSSPVSKESCAI